MNSNYNGPLQGTLLGNNMGNFNFVETSNKENENKSRSFLNKKSIRYDHRRRQGSQERILISLNKNSRIQ